MNSRNSDNVDSKPSLFLLQLPTTNFLVTIMPMRIGGGSGAPARIIAEVFDESEGVLMSHQHTSAAMGPHTELPLLQLVTGLLLVVLIPH